TNIASGLAVTALAFTEGFLVDALLAGGVGVGATSEGTASIAIATTSLSCGTSTPSAEGLGPRLRVRVFWMGWACPSTWTASDDGLVLSDVTSLASCDVLPASSV
ncbi:MAG: hypothetical protein QMC17_08000, partial [Paracoccaceae bacterium]